MEHHSAEPSFFMKGIVLGYEGVYFEVRFFFTGILGWYMVK